MDRRRVRRHNTLDAKEFNVGWVVSWYYARYVGFDHAIFEPFVFTHNASNGPTFPVHYGSPLPMRPTSSSVDVDAYILIMGIADGRRLFVTRSVANATLKSFAEDARQLLDIDAATVEMKSYDGDTLDASVRTKVAGYVSFIDNWDPDWRACVNGKEVAIERLFGTFKSVYVPPGEHRVTFFYAPFPFRISSPCE